VAVLLVLAVRGPLANAVTGPRVSGRERHDVLEIESPGAVHAGDPAQHVVRVGEVDVLQRRGDALVGGRDARDRRNQGGGALRPSAAQSRDQTVDAGADDGTSNEKRLNHLERLDQIVPLDHTTLEIAVREHDQRVHRRAEGVEVPQVTRDLGIRRLRGDEQRPVHPRQCAPFLGVADQVGELETRELMAEGVVHAAAADDGDLATGLHDQVLPPEVGDGLTGVLLDRVPVLGFDPALVGMAEPHQHVVVDEFVVAQRLSGGVEALEDLLGVGAGAEGDRHVLELLQATPDVRCLVTADLAAEERVVVVEARVAGLAGGERVVEHHALEDRRPRVMRAQLRQRRVVGMHEHPRELIGECRVGPADGVMQGRDEQHERRRALLPVDEDELCGVAVPSCGREDRPDEVHVPVIEVGDCADVGEQLLARADVPPVLALVHRDDDGPIGCRQPSDRVDCGGVDIRGTDHGTTSLWSGGRPRALPGASPGPRRAAM
jgi:hypothetical protein